MLDYTFFGSVDFTAKEVWHHGTVTPHSIPESPTVQALLAYVRSISDSPKMAMLGGLDLVPHIGISITGPGGTVEVLR